MDVDPMTTEEIAGHLSYAENMDGIYTKDRDQEQSFRDDAINRLHKVAESYAEERRRIRWLLEKLDGAATSNTDDANTHVLTAFDAAAAAAEGKTIPGGLPDLQSALIAVMQSAGWKRTPRP